MIGVTKLIDLLNKPALLHWSNKIGLEGVSLKDYKNKSTEKGSDKHYDIENYLKNGILFNESNKLDCLLKDYKVLGVEKYISNDFIHGYCDLIIEKFNKKIIVDFKSSNKIYLSHKLQLSTYKEIYGADSIAIINFNDWTLNFIKIDTLKYYQIVKRLYQINELINDLNEKL